MRLQSRRMAATDFLWQKDIRLRRFDPLAANRGTLPRVLLRPLVHCDCRAAFRQPKALHERQVWWRLTRRKPPAGSSGRQVRRCFSRWKANVDAVYPERNGRHMRGVEPDRGAPAASSVRSCAMARQNGSLRIRRPTLALARRVDRSGIPAACGPKRQWLRQRRKWTARTASASRPGLGSCGPLRMAARIHRAWR